MFDVDLNSGHGQVKQVSLMLYSHTRSQAGYQVRLVSERWRERKITFANAPMASREFGAVRAAAGKGLEGRRRHFPSVRRPQVRRLRADDGFRERRRVCEPQTKAHGPRLVVEREGDTTTSTATTTGGGETPQP